MQLRQLKVSDFCQQLPTPTSPNGLYFGGMVTIFDGSLDRQQAVAGVFCSGPMEMPSMGKGPRFSGVGVGVGVVVFVAGRR